jgi:hypothetical protein
VILMAGSGVSSEMRHRLNRVSAGAAEIDGDDRVAIARLNAERIDTFGTSYYF